VRERIVCVSDWPALLPPPPPAPALARQSHLLLLQWLKLAVQLLLLLQPPRGLLTSRPHGCAHVEHNLGGVDASAAQHAPRLLRACEADLPLETTPELLGRPQKAGQQQREDG
jgi:hypothetical protein